MRLFNARQLARDIAEGKLGPEEKFRYLRLSLVVPAVLLYTGLMASSYYSARIMFYIEGGCYLLVTLIGINLCYKAHKTAGKGSFIENFVCLGVPVLITTVIPLWLIYWCLIYGFNDYLIQLSSSRLQIAVNLNRISADFFSLLTLLTLFAEQVIFFVRMQGLFSLIGREAGQTPLSGE